MGTVLVVDDSATMRDWLAACLSPVCTVRTAGSMDEGVQATIATAFDVVVADFDLGDGTGLTLLREVARIRSGAARILLTAHKDYSDVRDAQRSGDLLVIFKPVDEHVLVGWVRNAVTMARLNQATRRIGSGRLPRVPDAAGPAARPGPATGSMGPGEPRGR